MSQKTKKEVLAKWWCAHALASAKYKTELLNRAVELFGYHRKGSIRE